MYTGWCTTCVLMYNHTLKSDAKDERRYGAHTQSVQLQTRSFMELQGMLRQEQATREALSAKVDTLTESMQEAYTRLAQTDARNETVRHMHVSQLGLHSPQSLFPILYPLIAYRFCTPNSVSLLMMLTSRFFRSNKKISLFLSQAF